MDKFVVLKNKTKNMYYSNKCFMEPNKQFADRLRLGQANALKFNYSRFSNKDLFEIESIE